MADFYTRASETAASLLFKFGLPLKVSRQGATVSAGFGIFKSSRTVIDATGQYQTALTDLSMTVSALSKEPLVGDNVFFNKTLYTITSIEPLAPTGKALAYTIGLAYA